MPARIVIVHDDPSFRDPLATSLRALGLDVATFADSMTAWEALNAARQLEILVTRVQFDPGQPHGVALALSARARCPGVRVLFVARPIFDVDIEGVGVLLPLPASIPEVAEAIGRMLSNPRLGRV